MSVQPGPEEFNSNNIMLGFFIAVWVSVISYEAGSALISHDDEIDTFAYPIEVPEDTGGTFKGEDVIDILALINEATAARGARVAKKCQSCHTFGPGERNGTGPNLHNVVGASISDRDRGGFVLTNSLIGAGGTWTYELLNQYVENPKNVAPRGSMSFAGLKKPGDRAAIIKFLMSYTDNPPAIAITPITETNTGEAEEGNTEASSP